MYKNDDTIVFGSGSEERNITWTIKNIREYNTGNYYSCGVCKVKRVCCDIVADGQETITIDTGSIDNLIEFNDQHPSYPISYWRKDIFKIPPQGDE